MRNYGCPECGSTAKKHSEEDCDMAQFDLRDSAPSDSDLEVEVPAR